MTPNLAVSVVALLLSQIPSAAVTRNVSIVDGGTGLQTPRTEVVLLGTGMPYPNPERQGPATAIVYNKRVFLFDAGSGVERQMNAAKLPISGPEALFITHLHSDHTLGYADIILTSWVMRRTKPFRVFGPPGTQRMTDHLLAAFSEDIEIRTKGLEREVPNGERVAVKEIRPGVVYDSGGVKVTAFSVPHGSWKYAFGYRVDTPDRSIVIAGDTRPSENVIRAARNVDVLIHEVYPHTRAKPEDRPGGELWPQYLRAFHTSDIELGKVAARARPRLLLLTHVMLFGGSEPEVVSGIRQGGFKGAIVVGKDLARY